MLIELEILRLNAITEKLNSNITLHCYGYTYGYTECGNNEFYDGFSGHIFSLLWLQRILLFFSDIRYGGFSNFGIVSIQCGFI